MNQKPNNKFQISLDSFYIRDLLADAGSIGRGGLCVNKKSAATRYGQGLNGQKTTYCDAYYREKLQRMYQMRE